MYIFDESFEQQLVTTILRIAQTWREKYTEIIVVSVSGHLDCGYLLLVINSRVDFRIGLVASLHAYIKEVSMVKK